MPSFFYILFSVAINKFYIGHTSNSLEVRLRKHNTNHKGFTGKSNDWIVVYSEQYPRKSSHMPANGKSKIGKAEKELSN